MKSVVQLNGTRIIARYPSISSAARITGADKSNIAKVIAGSRRSARGANWRTTASREPHRYSIGAFDISTGDNVAVFRDIDSIAFTTLSSGLVKDALRGRVHSSYACGLKWSYVH